MSSPFFNLDVSCWTEQLLTRAAEPPVSILPNLASPRLPDPQQREEAARLGSVHCSRALRCSSHRAADSETPQMAPEMLWVVIRPQTISSSSCLTFPSFPYTERTHWGPCHWQISSSRNAGASPCLEIFKIHLGNP